jgi:hypothetical protein
MQPAPMRTGRPGTATARSATTPAAGPKALRDAGRAVRAKTSSAGLALPRMPFVLLVLGMLGGGLVCLLVVNTTLGAASFRLSQLQSENTRLSLQERTLQGRIQNEQAPDEIAKRAYQLGMRAEANATILDLRNGRYYRLHDQAAVINAASGMTQAAGTRATGTGVTKAGAAPNQAARHRAAKHRTAKHRTARLPAAGNTAGVRRPGATKAGSAW